MAAAASQAGLRTGDGTRPILAASVGNLLEWYDFSVYAVFAIYIGANFFPKGGPGVDLVKAFLVFGLGFVIRPLGAIAIGMYADRAGRKAALTATILIMAGGTLIIAAAPTYAVIGVGAPMLLLAGRLLQGFSAGGEIGSAAAFLVEHAPPGRKGLFAAWLQGSMGMSNILGALVAFAVTSLLPMNQVIGWGWRIPFIIGLAIFPIGLYLRRTLEETPEFRAEFERSHAAAPRAPRLPLIDVFREHSAALCVGFGISILWAVAVYVLLIFMPVFVQKALGYTRCASVRQLADRKCHFRRRLFPVRCVGRSHRLFSDAGARRRGIARCRAAVVHVARSVALDCRARSRALGVRHHGRELHEHRADGPVQPVSDPGPLDGRVARL